MSFELDVKSAAEKAVLQFIQSGGWLLPNYDSRLKIPAEWIADCWRLVDAEKLKAKIAERLESELADRMVNHMAAELATDIKQILSVQERREALRALARDPARPTCGPESMVHRLMPRSSVCGRRWGSE